MRSELTSIFRENKHTASANASLVIHQPISISLYIGVSAVSPHIFIRVEHVPNCVRNKQHRTKLMGQSRDYLKFRNIDLNVSIGTLNSGRRMGK